MPHNRNTNPQVTEIVTAAKAALIIGALAVVGFATPARAESAGARMLVDAVAARTTAVSSYTANISLHVQLHSFPFISMRINGDTSYQQPGQYTVKMHTLPALAKAFENVSGDAGDPNVWIRKYDITIDRGAQAPRGQIALRMTQKAHGQIDHAEAFINTSNMTVARMEWFYTSGGHIGVDYEYTQIGEILMVNRQTAEISMPNVRATATAELSNYALQTDLALNSTTHKSAASQ